MLNEFAFIHQESRYFKTVDGIITSHISQYISKIFDRFAITFLSDYKNVAINGRIFN